MKKKLIVKQVDECDCGVCSLLSIIRYYKGNVPLEILKINTNTDKFGTNAYELIKCASIYGLEGKGLKVERIDNLDLPVIAHLKLDNDFYHFVVLYKIKDTTLEIMDPAKGKIILAKENFYKIFTGNIINLKPVTNIPYLKSDTTLKQIVFKFFKNNKKSIIFFYFNYLLLLFITILFSCIFYLFLNNKKLLLFSFIFLALLILKVLLTYIKNKKYFSLENLLKLNLANNFFNHLLFLPQKYIQMKSSGEILTRFNELNLLSEFISNLFLKNVIEVISIIVVSIILFIFNINALLILLVLLLFYVFISVKYNNFLSPLIVNQINAEADYNSDLNHYVNSIHNIILIGNREYFQTKFSQQLNNKYQKTFNFNQKINLGENLKEFLYYLIYLLLVIYFFSLHNPLINIITLINLIVIILDNTKSLLNDLPLYAYGKNIFIKISEFFGVEEPTYTNTLLNFNNQIIFNQVKFTYDKINYFKYNFKINYGEHIMIKGQNGCGKSTFCQLLCGNLSNYDGTITINNTNLKDLDSNALKYLIAYSDQKAVLFKDTIKNNITLNQIYEESFFRDICQICDIESIVSKKRNRFNTLIYENCPNLSGGEIQKIILARTLLLNKQIIILDETLSEVSITSEIKIIKNIRAYFKNKTIIYITHKNLEKYFDRFISLN